MSIKQIKGTATSTLELCLAGLLQAEYSSAYFGTIFHNLKMVYIAPHLQIHSTHLYREQ